MGARARDAAVTRFSAERMQREYLELYARVLAPDPWYRASAAGCAGSSVCITSAASPTRPLAIAIARSCSQMRDRIAHRGPDDGGLWQSDDGRVVLGHRRLSIVDLSAAGHQPMSNEDGAVWITFNGEIYNHAELRTTLRLDDRHKFRSRADTEVIVHLYEERQLGVVEALDGMFAFGLWDASRRRLVLARDRMGKKPLYYVVAAGRLLFASEIKALLEHPDVARRLDLVALNEYLTFSNVPEPRTMFEGIRKLPAGPHPGLRRARRAHHRALLVAARRTGVGRAGQPRRGASSTSASW